MHIPTPLVINWQCGPYGRFFQNNPLGPGQGYVYSPSILDVGVEAAFAEMAFDSDRFCARYTPAMEGGRA